MCSSIDSFISGLKILKSTLGERAGVRGACLLARKNYVSMTF